MFMQNKFWQYMRDLNIPRKLINLVGLIINDMQYPIKIGNATSDVFEISTELK